MYSKRLYRPSPNLYKFDLMRLRHKFYGEKPIKNRFYLRSRNLRKMDLNSRVYIGKNKKIYLSIPDFFSPSLVYFPRELRAKMYWISNMMEHS